MTDSVCNICKKPLDASGPYLDCGGDCLVCMALIGHDPDCGDALREHVDRLVNENAELRRQVRSGIDRLNDMLMGDDGQAWKEARRALPAMHKALGEEPES